MMNAYTRHTDGAPMSLWLDKASKARLARLRSTIPEKLGIKATSSVILRASLRLLEERLERLEMPQTSDDLTVEHYVLKLALAAAGKAIESF
ncbi:MAG TPA: hypothetical protein VKY65_14600 [Alphaproteobacteria bacterium]|nr:hypothetical protein [Alphaproteobacteria bacterium]